MFVNSTKQIQPEHHLPPYKSIRATADLLKPDRIRYYEKLELQRQNLKKLVEGAISKQECEEGAEQLATILRKFHKI